MSEQTKQIDDDGPAFPTDEYFNEKRYGIRDGMTLRDYFAAKAMQSLFMNPGVVEMAEGIVNDGKLLGEDMGFQRAAREAIAAKAYRIADAMLAARKAGGR